MSVTHCFTVFCDECAAWIQGNEDEALAHLIVRAHHAGWRGDCPAGTPKPRVRVHYCPGCSQNRPELRPLINVTDRKPER